VENIEQRGNFWYFRYPVVETKVEQAPEHVVIATTRPETMLGDTCVAVHPQPRRELEKRAAELRDKLSKATDKEKKELQARLEKLQERQATMLPQLETLAEMARTGTMLLLPLVGRRIPLIADDYADPEKGTGAVKITPAHDFNDYAVGQRHPEIGPPINILQPNGTINEMGQGEYCGQKYSYTGQDRFAARKQIVKDLDALGLLQDVEEINNTIPMSDRSKTPVEPYFSDQWFVKMDKLAQDAMDAVTDGRVKFFPERYARTYLEWLGEKRDWCVSRQLWWGHRIPIWYARCSESALKAAFANRSDVSWRHDSANDQWLISALADLPATVPGTDAPLTQDPDVLDTWFSSALWPHSTLGWPEQTADLKYYYPTSVLVTNRDIITLWVARMVITGLYNTGKIPFHHVYIHATVQDGFGERMNKTKGNGIDPLDIIERYGTDALRFIMVQQATDTQDSRMPVSNVCPHCDTLVPVKREHMEMRTRRVTCPNCKKGFRPGGGWPAPDPELITAKQASEKFELGRNFANKVWNASRFLLLNLEGYQPQAIDFTTLAVEDRWILSRLATTTTAVTQQLESYRFSDAARTLYDFFWSEFCDWYIEMSKGRLRDDAGRALVQCVLVTVLDGFLRLVQPIMPFLAESVWQALAEAAPVRGLPQPTAAVKSVVIAPWPTVPVGWQDGAIEQRLARMQELVRFVRDVRNRYTLDAKTPLNAFVRCSAALAADFTALTPFVQLLAGVGSLACGPDVVRPPQAATQVTADFEAYVSLQGLIDVAAERKRLEKQLAEKQKFLGSTQGKLGNANFVKNAPPEVVQQQREQVADLTNQIAILQTNLAELG
jgi:valyl-tRNA synthetase